MDGHEDYSQISEKKEEEEDLERESDSDISGLDS